LQEDDENAYLPTPQIEHADCPPDVVTVPKGHGVHTKLVAAEEYFPASHSVQNLLLVEVQAVLS
jgi:hypothetical protein